MYLIGVNDSNIKTARTYAFIGFIFYLLSIIFEILVFFGFSFFFITSVQTSISPSVPSISYIVPFYIGIIFFVILAIGIIFTIWSWITVRRFDQGNYGEARTYSLILGIVGIFFGLLIGGIFFLLAYAKAGEGTTLPPIQRFCVQCGRPVSSDAKFCPNCGKELP